jgi:ABC-2 type transport system ATP-binding protein
MSGSARPALTITLDGVRHRLGRFELDVPALSIGRGVTAVVGRNGSGKTTLLRALATVLRPDSGRIVVAGLDTATEPGMLATRRRLGYLPQDDSVPLRLRAFDHVDLVAVMRELGPTVTARRRFVVRALGVVGMLDHAGDRAEALSGGQRRRVALAAAIAGDPEVLVLDEPDAHLDDEQRRAVADHLRSLAATVVVTTHDRAWAAATADRVIEMDAGRVVAA